MSHNVPRDPKPEMTEFETSLSSLSPARSAVNRDAIMFRAGQRSMQRNWVWPSATAALTLISLGEAALLATRPTPEPRIIERIVEVPAPAAAPVATRRPVPEDYRGPSEPTTTFQETGALARHDYYHLREQALRFGVDNLPSPISSREDPEKSAESFRTEIRTLLDPGGTL